MKKIMKLFPAALAVLALASCSDDLMTNSTKSADENALYFTMESTSDATRAGVVGDATDALSALSFRWTKGDEIRVYDQNLAMYDVYKYGGESFLENTPAAQFTNPAPWDEKKLDSYTIGVYPNDAVEAVYLDKTDREKKHIVMNVPAEYTYEASTADGKEAIRCDVPMYGNIDDVTTGVTQMNFLTAWTRIYTRNIPADIKYLCVVSENPLQPLTGQFEAQVHYPLASTDEPWLQKKDDVEETWGNIMYSDISATPAAFREKGGICFPLLVQKYAGLHIYGLKSSAGVDPTDPTLDPQVDPVIAATTWGALVAGGEAIEIASKEDLNIQRRRQCWTVLYTYTYYLNTDDLTPFRPGEVSKVLAANKDNIIGNFRIVPSDVNKNAAAGKVLTAGPGDYYTHRIEIPKIKAGEKAKIILDFSQKGIQYDEALQVYDLNPETSQFDGELTIIPGPIVGGTAKIEINLPKATVTIVGNDAGDALGNIDIQNAKEVHIGDGSTATLQNSTQSTKVQGGKLYVEKNATVMQLTATKFLGNPAQFATDVIVNGGTVGFLYNETANITLLGNGWDAAAKKQYTGEGFINSLECTNLEKEVKIISKGRTKINKFKTPDTMQKLTIESTLLPKDNTTANADVFDPIASNFVTTVNDGEYSAIFTAAQLASSAIAAEVSLMTDVMDLNNIKWTGKALSANFIAYNYGKDASVAAQLKLMTKTKDNIIKNLKLAKPAAAGNGLFGSTGAAVQIKGVKLQTVKMEENQTAPTDAPLGAFVGKATKAVTMDKVEVSGLVFSSQDGNIMGGLIGSITGADAIVSNAKVAGTITCRGFGGGMIGQLVANDATFTDCEASVTFTHSMAGATLHTNYAGTFGTFVGGATGAAHVIIKDCKFGTAIDKALKGNGNSNSNLCFGAIMTTADIPYFGGNAWVGRFTGSDFTTLSGSLVTYKSVSAADKGKKFYKFVYAASKMTQTRYEGAGNYAETAQKNLDGGALNTTGKLNSIVYEGGDDTTTGYVKSDSRQYGANIFSRYNATPDKLSYDNVYVDGVE